MILQMAFDPKRILIPETMGLPQWAMENCPKSIETPHLKIVPRAKTVWTQQPLPLLRPVPAVWVPEETKPEETIALPPKNGMNQILW